MGYEKEEEEVESSSTPKKGKYHRKTIPMEKVRDIPYLKRGARVIHI